MLPPSLTVNASSANGLGACTPEQIGLLSPTNERQFFHFDSDVAKSFSLSYGGQSTAAIPAPPAPPWSPMRSKRFPGWPATSKSTAPPERWIVTFVGGLAGTDVPELIAEITYLAAPAVGSDRRRRRLQPSGRRQRHRSRIQGELPPGQVFIFPQSPSHELRAGETIVGPGIAPGTKITLANSFITIIDTPTIAETQNGTFRTVVPYNATGKEVQEALESLPTIGPGNVFVHDAGIVDTTHSYRIIFTGSLAGGGPALTTTTLALTGAGAGATIGSRADRARTSAGRDDRKGRLAQFTNAPADCPDSAKLGTVRIEQRSGGRPPAGRVRLPGQPHRESVRLAARHLPHVDDAADRGRPQAPGEDRSRSEDRPADRDRRRSAAAALRRPAARILQGRRAPLKTGIACGTFKVNSDMTPWTAPEGAIVHPTDTLQDRIRARRKAPASNDEASAPDAPSVEAGTFEPDRRRSTRRSP